MTISRDDSSDHKYIQHMILFILQVSATFAASLVTSPALGAYLASVYSDNFVIWLAAAVALLDVLFILVVVPESLPEKVRPSSWGSPVSWDKVDPFSVSLAVTRENLFLDS